MKDWKVFILKNNLGWSSLSSENQKCSLSVLFLSVQLMGSITMAQTSNKPDKYAVLIFIIFSQKVSGNDSFLIKVLPPVFMKFCTQCLDQFFILRHEGNVFGLIQVNTVVK